MRQEVSHLTSSLPSGRLSFTPSPSLTRIWDRGRKAAARPLPDSSARGLDSIAFAVYGMLSERSINRRLFSKGCSESKSEEWRSMARKILRPAKKPSFLIRDRDLLQQKREGVAEAAFELFLKEGFHRTTTRDIARR